MTPVSLLVEGSPDAVPRGPVLRFPVFMLFSIIRTFAGFLRFSLVCSSGSGLSVYVSSSLCFVEVFFAPASVHPQLVYLALF